MFSCFLKASLSLLQKVTLLQAMSISISRLHLNTGGKSYSHIKGPTVKPAGREMVVCLQVEIKKSTGLSPLLRRDQPRWHIQWLVQEREIEGLLAGS